MKNSKIIWVHVCYWILVIVSQLVTVLAVRIASITTLGKLRVWLINPMSGMVVFYAAYLLTWFYLKKDKRTAILIFISLLIALFIAAYFVGDNKIVSGIYCVVCSLGFVLFGILFYLGIDWYNKKQRQKELEKQNLQSELKMLKNQINPHFLFNTLNSISRTVSLGKYDESVLMIDSLTKLLRYTLSNTDEPASLSDELYITEQYLMIQKLRFSSRLEYEINADPDYTKEVYLPRLTIQPLVENAVVHGLEPATPGGKIVITVRRNEMICEVSIADDGVGMCMDSLLNMIYAGPSKNNQGSIGVSNTRDRLRLFTHKENVMDIRSVEGKGTEIILKIDTGGNVDV
jgi:lipid-A-disaccharide synthase-like uncharacterized protein